MCSPNLSFGDHTILCSDGDVFLNQYFVICFTARKERFRVRFHVRVVIRAVHSLWNPSFIRVFVVRSSYIHRLFVVCNLHVLYSSHNCRMSSRRTFVYCHNFLPYSSYIRCIFVYLSYMQRRWVLYFHSTTTSFINFCRERLQSIIDQSQFLKVNGKRLSI